jgi:hypothetical protein
MKTILLITLAITLNACSLDTIIEARLEMLRDAPPVCAHVHPFTPRSQWCSTVPVTVHTR